MKWLEQLTNWLAQKFREMLEWLNDMFQDILLFAVDAFLDLAEAVIAAIPTPDFLTTYSLNSLVGQAGPIVAWLFSTFRVGECLGILGAGWVFRLVRKLLTVGQW